MARKWSEERVERERKWISREREYATGKAKRPKPDFPYEEEPRTRTIREPTGDWSPPVFIRGAVVVTRPVKVIGKDIETGETVDLGTDVEEERISLPSTRNCFLDYEGHEESNPCERLKVALACSGKETGGQLTPLQGAAVAEITHDEAKECVGELERKGMVKRTDDRWIGESYWVMPSEKRGDVRRKIETRRELE